MANASLIILLPCVQYVHAHRPRCRDRYAFSVVAVLFPQVLPASYVQHGAVPVYFEAAAIIVVLVLLGQVLEAKARSPTNSAIKALLNKAAKTARVVRDGIEQEIPVADVKKGDKIRVRPGEKVPVDGLILEGSSSLDESMAPANQCPFEKKQNDKVIGATINQTGSFLMQAEKVGSETMLAQIVKMVSAAQRSRAPIHVSPIPSQIFRARCHSHRCCHLLALVAVRTRAEAHSCDRQRGRTQLTLRRPPKSFERTSLRFCF